MNNEIEKYNKEDRIILKNIINKYELCKKGRQITNIEFYDSYEINLIISFLNKLKIPYHIYDIDNFLEKKLITFKEEQQNLTLLKIKSKNKLLQHKDYMGAIYNIGISPNKIGDIILIEDVCYFFTGKNLVNYFETNLITVGNSLVEVEEVPIDSINYQRTYTYINKSLVSLRLDVALAKLYNLSRSDIQKKISSKDVIVNSLVTTNSIKNIKENDKISFKKYGKVIINKININSKGKYVVEFKIYS